ncbi:MAG: hypothetical protein NVSMB22_14010 [Chloroflexota bacterium]
MPAALRYCAGGAPIYLSDYRGDIHSLRRAVFVTFILCLGLSLRATYNARVIDSRSATVRAREQVQVTMGVPPGVRAYLSQETDPALFRVLYQYGQAIAASNGAVGPNISAPRSRWYLEYQRAGGLDVIAGVMRGDTTLIDRGLLMFRYGLDREATNGDFPGSMWPFHGTAMFLAEAAPALLVLSHASENQHYAREIAWQVAAMHRAAHRMVRRQGGPGHIDDGTKNHRFFEAALALEAVGTLAHDAQLQRWATVYARRGIAMERPTGVMPEDGGHDSGYQAVGLTDAIRYLALTSGRAISSRLHAAVQRAEEWELSRVHPNGSIDQTGDTRTVGCRERDPQGRCKSAFYAPIFNALTRWGIVAADTRYERAALDVWLVNWAIQPGDVLPPPGLFAQPNPVHAGEWLTIWGTRFRPLESVTIFVNGRVIERVACDQIGSFGGHSPQPNAHFPLPDGSGASLELVARGSLGTVRRTMVQIQR